MPRVEFVRQDLGAHGQPLSEHDFLLVAAGQIADRLPNARRLGAQPLHAGFRDDLLRGSIEPTETCVVLDVGQ